VTITSSPFAERLRRLGLGPAQIARLAGTSSQYISQVLHGRRPPSLRLRGLVDKLEERRARMAAEEHSPENDGRRGGDERAQDVPAAR
jgi:transcriptional regulator with XRE-family HTH domain